MSQKRKEKKSVKDSFLSEFFADEPKIEMLGNRELIIDGCKGIVEYGENLIKLSLGESAVSICGNNLVITSFDRRVAIINGKIGEISFIS